MSSVFVGLMFLVFTFFTVKIVSPDVKTNAERQTQTRDTGAYTIAMSTEKDVNIELSATNTSQTYTATNTLGVTNTCSYGATVTMTTDSSSNALNKEILGSGDLPGSIPATSGTTLQDNTWGYSVNGGSTYSAVPALGNTPATLYNSTSNQNINVVYGVRVNNDLLPGIYTAGTVYTLTPSPDCINYSVTWNMGGGQQKQGVIYPSAIPFTDKINLSNLKPTREGYIFLGWRTSVSREFTGDETSVDINPTNSGNLTITAQWAVDSNEQNLTYNGDTQSFTAPYDGYYKLEAWGAQGGTYSSTEGGKGGYSIGTYQMTKGQKLYIGIGGRGGTSGSAGYNGGGTGNSSYTGGGGATHIALEDGLLKNISASNVLLVAGGGGGSGQDYSTSYSVSGSATWTATYQQNVTTTTSVSGTTSWQASWPGSTTTQTTKTQSGTWSASLNKADSSSSCAGCSADIVGTNSSPITATVTGTVSVAITSGGNSKTSVAVVVKNVSGGGGVYRCSQTATKASTSCTVNEGERFYILVDNWSTSTSARNIKGTYSYPYLETNTVAATQTASGSNTSSSRLGTAVKSFTAYSAGTVSFWSTSYSRDPYCTIYVNGSSKVTNDDGGDGNNFKCETTVSEGDSVVLYSGLYSSTSSSTSTQTVTQTGTTNASSRIGTLAHSFTANVDGTFTFESTSSSRDPFCTVYVKSNGSIVNTITNDDGGNGNNYKCEGSYSNGNTVEFYSGLYSSTSSTTYATASGGYGGGTSGGAATGSSAGSQSSGNAYGQGGNSSSGAGGGGGYYGGVGNSYSGGGGGGSGYVNTSLLVNSPVTYNGGTAFVSPTSSSNETGHAGNGAVRITYLGTSF